MNVRNYSDSPVGDGRGPNWPVPGPDRDDRQEPEEPARSDGPPAPDDQVEFGRYTTSDGSNDFGPYYGPWGG